MWFVNVVFPVAPTAHLQRRVSSRNVGKRIVVRIFSPKGILSTMLTPGVSKILLYRMQTTLQDLVMWFL
jgi:hypothetical protein